jgi:hypothetical protein
MARVRWKEIRRMREEENPVIPNRDVGQGDRDMDPRLARDREIGERRSGLPARSDVPDFTSGPEYTGEVPPEGESRSQGDWNAGGDISDTSGP